MDAIPLDADRVAGWVYRAVGKRAKSPTAPDLKNEKSRQSVLQGEAWRLYWHHLSMASVLPIILSEGRRQKAGAALRIGIQTGYLPRTDSSTSLINNFRMSPFCRPPFCPMSFLNWMIIASWARRSS